MNKEEKEDMEFNIEAKYVGKTEKEFLNIITYAECLYILNTKNNYCDDIKDLSLLKIVDIISKLQKENEKLKKQSEISAKTHIKNDDLKDKVIDKMAKTISGLALYDFNRKEYFTLEDEGEVREYFYKKVSE